MCPFVEQAGLSNWEIETLAEWVLVSPGLLAAMKLAVVKMMLPALAPLGSDGWPVLFPKIVLRSKRMLVPSPHDCLFLDETVSRLLMSAVSMRVRLVGGEEGTIGPRGFPVGKDGPSSSSCSSPPVVWIGDGAEGVPSTIVPCTAVARVEL